MSGLFDNYVNNSTKKCLYFPCLGITNTKCWSYNQYMHTYAKILFQILDKYDINYYVFAGSSIGMLRNGKNIPWADDYDIMIFDKDIDKLVGIKHIIEKNGFEFNARGKLYRSGIKIISPSICYSGAGSKTANLLLDVFTTVVKNGVIKGINSHWGMYNSKNVPYSFVEPKIYKQIDDLTLPFFNKYEDDIKLEYGDVINYVNVHVNHSKSQQFNIDYKDAYKQFEEFRQKAENNVRESAKIGEHKYISSKMLKLAKDATVLDCLSYISINNIKTLNILEQKYLNYVISIKYYFPNIKINYYVFDTISASSYVFMNFIDNIYYSKSEIVSLFYDSDIIFTKKPILNQINTVITFGTYDLFHVGHKNILERAKNLGNKLVVGVSSDSLNIKKGKTSVNNVQKRMRDVKASGYSNTIFIEESLELKNEYIKNYNSDLLVMGDDWLDKFDWVDCPVIYLPRTPNISTTMLKQQMRYF